MTSWLATLSIRTRIVLLVCVVLVPMAGMGAWFLDVELRHARDDAHARVRLLATSAAADVEGFLSRSDAVLGRLAQRPLVRALDPGRCDSIVAEFVKINPEYLSLGVHDRQGRLVCSDGAGPDPRPDPRDSSWFNEAIRHDDFFASDAIAPRRNGRWMTVLSHRIDDDTGTAIGLLSLPVDLLQLSQHLLTATPDGAVVTVVDRRRAVLLRSADAAAFIGHRPEASAGAAGPGRREGDEISTGRDGVRRLEAFVTLPGAGWRVVAGLPESAVFAEYHATVRRAVGIGVAVLLLAVALAWRMGAAIAQPITELAAVAAAVAAGDSRARAKVSGTVEVASVAHQFNQMLDARDHAAAVLSESEERYRALVDWSPEAISVHRDGKLVFVNEATVRMLRANSAQDLLGRPSLDFVHPDFHQRVLELTADAVEHGRAVPPMEEKFVRWDGTTIDVEVHGIPIVYDGEVAVFASMRDVTERRAHALALRDSEARLRLLLVLLPEAVVVNRANRIVFVNEAARRLYGADEAALLGRAPLELVHPDSVEFVNARMAAMRSGATMNPLAEVKILRLDGSARTVEAVSAQVDDGAEPSIVVVMRDVTEHRQMQSELARSHSDLRRLIAQQDKVQEEERKRIGRELHDDLQQTLAAIRIDLGELGGRLATDPAKSAPLLAEIDELALSAIASTRRIVNGLRPQLLEDFGLVPALEVLARQFHQHYGIECDVEAADQANDELMASPAIATALFRAAQEALNNVAKHAGASKVQVRLARAADGRIVLRVSDDGSGMAAGERRRSESFGLLGMRERVRAFGGTLRIDSRPGSGTTLEVFVPAPQAAALVDEPAAGAEGEPATGVAHPLQEVIDALTGNVAVVDAQGTIVLVNRAWREFAERNGDPGARASGPGVNYLEVCRRAAATDEAALQAWQGFQALLDGTRSAYETVYPCHGPDEQRWFRLHVTPMAGGDLLVTHFNLTHWIDPAHADGVPGERA